MELAGLEPATSWVRLSRAGHVPVAGSGRFPAQSDAMRLVNVMDRGGNGLAPAQQVGARRFVQLPLLRLGPHQRVKAVHPCVTSCGDHSRQEPIDDPRDRGLHAQRIPAGGLLQPEARPRRTLNLIDRHGHLSWRDGDRHVATPSVASGGCVGDAPAGVPEGRYVPRGTPQRHPEPRHARDSRAAGPVGTHAARAS